MSSPTKRNVAQDIVSVRFGVDFLRWSSLTEMIGKLNEAFGEGYEFDLLESVCGFSCVRAPGFEREEGDPFTNTRPPRKEFRFHHLSSDWPCPGKLPPDSIRLGLDPAVIHARSSNCDPWTEGECDTFVATIVREWVCDLAHSKGLKRVRERIAALGVQKKTCMAAKIIKRVRRARAIAADV
jgi:hypothetical protein